MKRIIPVLLALATLLGSAPSGAALQGGERLEKRVALTFDDGPHPGQTVRILDYLDSEGIKATFFVIGLNAEQWRDIVQREIDGAHAVGNHTYSHNVKLNADPDKLLSDLRRNDALLEELFGYKTSIYRPVEGACGENVKNAANMLGNRIVLWDIDTRDWAHTPTEQIVRTVMKNVKDGDIILFHDYVGGECHTLDALKIIVPGLKSRGYTFVTVPELDK